MVSVQLEPLVWTRTTSHSPLESSLKARKDRTFNITPSPVLQVERHSVRPSYATDVQRKCHGP